MRSCGGKICLFLRLRAKKVLFLVRSETKKFALGKKTHSAPDVSSGPPLRDPSLFTGGGGRWTAFMHPNPWALLSPPPPTSPYYSFSTHPRRSPGSFRPTLCTGKLKARQHLYSLHSSNANGDSSDANGDSSDANGGSSDADGDTN